MKYVAPTSVSFSFRTTAVLYAAWPLRRKQNELLLTTGFPKLFSSREWFKIMQVFHKKKEWKTIFHSESNTADAEVSVDKDTWMHKNNNYWIFHRSMKRRYSCVRDNPVSCYTKRLNDLLIVQNFVTQLTRKTQCTLKNRIQSANHGLRFQQKRTFLCTIYIWWSLSRW